MSRCSAVLVVLGALLVAPSALLVGAPPLAAADSFTPVRLAITVTPIARRDSPLTVTVGVSADAAVLDGSAGPLRVGVKLAGECGSTFETTPGATLVNRRLDPQPTTGQAYAGSVRGAGRPTTYGSQTVCVFLEDTDVGRVYANDESSQVDVNRACTAAAQGYDAAVRSLARAQKQLRHARHAAARRRLRRTIAARRRTLNRELRQGRAACGSGVAL